MKAFSSCLIALLLVAGSLPSSAQAPKLSGLVQVWYTQMLDNNLRINNNTLRIGGVAAGDKSYYNLRSEFRENTFTIRRTEIKLSGSITDNIDYDVMFDPAIGSGNSNILQDAFITYKLGGGFEFKIGQFKNLQTYEGVMSSSELLFAERAQITRIFGDNRDRGAMLAYGFGDPKEFAGKASVAFFNGSGKVNDANAQKDLVARLEFNVGKPHRFGVYTLQGSTDLQDRPASPATVARTFLGATPTVAFNQQVVDNKDKTTNLGAFYVFQNSDWHASAEFMTGLLGRRAASLGGGNALREHLDQKFTGYVLTGGYTCGHHTFLLRYDQLDYNSGSDRYTSYNPYTNASPTAGITVNGAPVDYTPKYREITAGYLYAFKPDKLKAANIKVNYIARSKNFLAPATFAGSTQTGEQGGNSLIAAFQIAF